MILLEKRKTVPSSDKRREAMITVISVLLILIKTYVISKKTKM